MINFIIHLIAQYLGLHAFKPKSGKLKGKKGLLRYYSEDRILFELFKINILEAQGQRMNYHHNNLKRRRKEKIHHIGHLEV